MNQFNIQEVFSWFIQAWQSGPQVDLFGATGRYIKGWQDALFGDYAVAAQAPVYFVALQRLEIVVVVNGDHARLREARCELHLLVDPFNLPVSRLYASIREHNPVEVEVAAGRYIGWAIIAAVGPVRHAIFIVLEQALVYPVPDKSTGEDVVLVNDIPVLLHVAGAVAHGMCVLD